MNTEFIDSFRRPKLHGNFIMDLNPFSKLNLCALIAAFAGVIGGVASSVVAILLHRHHGRGRVPEKVLGPVLESGRAFVLLYFHDSLCLLARHHAAV